jgi:hypothetical protein
VFILKGLKMQKLLQDRAFFVSVHSRELRSFAVGKNGMRAGEGAESNSGERLGHKTKKAA